MDEKFKAAQIFGEMLAEQVTAERRWTLDFDDKNTLNDWVIYITQYASSAAKFGNTKEETRDQLIKAGGLVIAALKALERNDGFPKRHYD